MARILVTGSRNWTDDQIIKQQLKNIWLSFRNSSDVLVVGDCPTGVDKIARDCWEFQGLPVEVHKADWNKHGKAAGPIRNQEMVDSGIDLGAAFILGESRGTRDCLHRPKRPGIPMTVIELP